jgi:hypothetical protein
MTEQKLLVSSCSNLKNLLKSLIVLNTLFTVIIVFAAWKDSCILELNPTPRTFIYLVDVIKIESNKRDNGTTSGFMKRQNPVFYNFNFSPVSLSYSVNASSDFHKSSISNSILIDSGYICVNSK